MTDGWLGAYESVLQVLKNLEADFFFNDDGSMVFNISGPLVIGMGGDEIIVGPEVMYFLDGEPKPLLDELRTANDGVVVRCI